MTLSPVATVSRVASNSRENTVALETADVVLLRGGLAGLPFLLDLGKATTRTINQNLIRPLAHTAGVDGQSAVQFNDIIMQASYEELVKRLKDKLAAEE